MLRRRNWFSEKEHQMDHLPTGGSGKTLNEGVPGWEPKKARA